MNIILGLILAFQAKLSIFHRKSAQDSASLAFFIDDIFGVFKIYYEQYIFLHDYFFCTWFSLS